MQNVNHPAQLRAQGEAAAQALPALIAQGVHLANAVLPGSHGRRRAGPGTLFWQYRRAEPHEARRIDWRRSARSDQMYVQEREWQNAQSVGLWVDPDRRMQFGDGATQKAARARLVAMALTIGLLRGGERVGLPGALPLSCGPQQRARMAQGLWDGALPAPQIEALPLGAQLVLISDFLTPLPVLEDQLRRCIARRITPVLCQVLHPEEVAFPFSGRVQFQDMQGQPQHETNNAGSIRQAYLARLEAHQQGVIGLARRHNARHIRHVTGDPAPHGLQALWRAMSQGAL